MDFILNKDRLKAIHELISCGDYRVYATGQVFSRRWGKGISSVWRECASKGPANRYKVIQFTYHAEKYNLRIHEIVAVKYLGDPPVETAVVDHRNNDPLDNRPHNLQWTNSRINSLKDRPETKAKSGLRGVRKVGKRYLAQIKYAKINHYLGMFDTKEEAARAYDKEALRVFGIFAKLNF